MFQVHHINVAQGPADGGLARHALTGWVKGCQEQRRVTLHPVGNRGSAALLTQHRAGNHAQDHRPLVAFAARVARIGDAAESVQQGAILGGIHRGVLLASFGHTQGYTTMDSDFDRTLDPLLVVHQGQMCK